MDKGMGAERQPCAASWLETYRPLRITPIDWALVRPFVLDMANQLGLRGGAGAVRTVRMLARLSVWALAEGLRLDVELVLDPDTVERFIAVGLADDPSRATYRATLRRAGPLLTTKAPWEPKATPLARRNVAPPYTDRELDMLRAAAVAQPTPGRRKAAQALLALGAGAGLDGRWVARIGADDVKEHRGVVLIEAGEPVARVVPVLAKWQEDVLDLAARAGDEFLVGGYSTARNRAGALAASLVVGNGHPRFSASRLRSTWLVTHLARGTRLPELARAAGLEGVTVLSDLLAFVPALDDDAAAEMLQGSR